MKEFSGYHSEWNLGSPGGWDYQRITQIIGKAVWERLNDIKPMNLELDFNHPLLYPVSGFVEMLAETHYQREGRQPGLIAIVAEEETLEDVTENKNLAAHISAIDGLTGGLMAPQELELYKGKVCWKGEPVSMIFMDFNTDVLLSLHRKHGLQPVLQAVKEHRVINPRGTEPINVKSMFEVMTGDRRDRFHQEIVERTPWTRQFYPRSTDGPRGERITDLIEWTRKNWDHLVLKPERGYSGHGVRVGGVNPDADEAINRAQSGEDYIVQEKVPTWMWTEDVPTRGGDRGELESVQTDFRCLMGPDWVFGFLGRYGGIPTNVGSGGGVQPMAVVKSGASVKGVVEKINDAIMDIPYHELVEVVDIQKKMAMDFDFTYLLGPIKIALRPRVIGLDQIAALSAYCTQMWSDCLTLEKMWLSGELNEIIKIEAEELEIARMHPWGGSPAIIASDGLFGFGAETEPG